MSLDEAKMPSLKDKIRGLAKKEEVVRRKTGRKVKEILKEPEVVEEVKVEEPEVPEEAEVGEGDEEVEGSEDEEL